MNYARVFYLTFLHDQRTTACLCTLLAGTLIFLSYFIGITNSTNRYREGLLRLKMEVGGGNHSSTTSACQRVCMPPGSKPLPKGIVSNASDMEMRPLWDFAEKINQKYPGTSLNLFAIAAGIKQKEIVNKIAQKFRSCGFTLMVFHYDGVLDEWSDLDWSEDAVHVFAINQTKWWFAKRFLHPDIVSLYDYVFLWDEDLGVDNFDPGRYLAIVREEGLEISQPGLEPIKSEVHHQITARLRMSKVHRNIYKQRGGIKCDRNSTAPPCLGWVEMMAPVFSRAAWRCVWYMIQNDLIHAWGLDKQLGYCAQGDRSKNVGVVDSEYIVHLGLPTLGVLDRTKSGGRTSRKGRNASMSESSIESGSIDNRLAVRKQSYLEMEIFQRRWKKAALEDRCWTDPYVT